MFIANFDMEVETMVDTLIDDSLLECLPVVERQRMRIVALINAGRTSCLSN